MARKFISFLGTGSYQESSYRLCESIVENVRYIQIALVKLLCKGWKPDDTIQIFITKDARDKNWVVNNGLKAQLQQLKELSDFNFTISAIDIPDGKNVDEIHEIFSIVNNSIGNGDEVTFDITHGFRSIPMLGIVLLNYAKVLKSIKLKGVYYGAWEANQDGVSPIFDLTEFDRLLSWTIATDQFISSGNAKKIAALTNQQVGTIFRNGDDEDIRNIAQLVNRFSHQLDKLTANISACRLKEIRGNVIELTKTCSQIENIVTVHGILKNFQIFQKKAV